LFFPLLGFFLRKYSLLLVLFSSASIIQAQTFSNGQAARAVLGQTNFTAGNPNSNQYTLGAVSGLAFANGTLWVADSSRTAATPNNSRIVAFPTAEIPGLRDDLGNDGLTNSDCYLCGFGGSLSLGQSSWTPPSTNTSCPSGTVTTTCFYTNRTQNGLANATGVATDGHYFAIADTDNNRVLLWNEIPTMMNQNADIVLGQTSFTSFKTPQTVDKYSLRGPQGVWIQNNHLFVADTQNNRVLIWNTIPTQNNQGADVVLGQNSFTANYQPTPSSTAPTVAANQLLGPVSVTADATHLYVADLGNNRVLIWNSIPTANAQNADVVVGQPDMTQSAANNPNVCTGYVASTLTLQCETSLNFPRFALPVNGQLFISDSGNDRVLIFNQIPTTNGKNATGVLGEPDFQQDVVSSASISIASTAIDNTGGVDLLPTPQALAWDGANLYVSDPYNRRVLVFTPGDNILAPNSIVNWASELIRQEGIVQISFPTGISATVAGDTVAVAIAGTSYTYTVVKNDTLDTIAQGLVKLINNAPDPNVKAIFDGTGTGTLYLSSIATDLGYDTIGLTATPSNPNDLTATASGAYLSAGTAATGAIGMLVEINGTNLADTTASANLDGVTVIPNRLAGVNVYMDGYSCPLLKVSPTQIVTQIPYSYLDRNSTSVYVRTIHNDGSVTVTAAIPVYIAPANPGIFDAPAFAGQARPWPIAQAFHQPGNATSAIDFEGTPTLGNTATITIGGTAYTYTVTAADVTTGALSSIVSNMVTLINATDKNVVASVGGAFNRILLTAQLPGAAGNGITVAVSSATSSTNTAAGNVTLTAYSPSTCCLVTPNSPIIPSNPAAPGELIQVTGAGLGLVADASNVAQGSLGTGAPYNGPADNEVQNFVTATMGGTTAQVISAFLPQGSYGTYNVQMVVPQGQATNSATTLNMAQNAFISNTVTIPVGPPVIYVVPPPSAPATTITEQIDAPSPGSTVSGILYASGWALNSQAPLTGVNISIDGKLYQAAQIGFTRTDVCAAFTSPACPYVGWFLPIDTTQFADGQHILAITALSTNGADYTVSQSFSILNNTSPATYPFHGSIDSPSSTFAYRGAATFSGWFTYASGTIGGVSVYVDGTPEGAASANARPDVCAIYPTPSCPNAGWYYTLDTNTLANGTHTLTAKAISSDGHTYVLSQTFHVQNFAGASATTYSTIESPSAGGTYSGTLSVGGWAGDLGTAVTSIGVTVDGVSYGNAAYGFARTDVCSGLALQGCPGVGFLATLDTTFLADGQHTLAIVINLAGQSVTKTQVFNVANLGTSANPLLGVIDTPTANSTVAGVFPASGWALSKTAGDPVTSVTLKVDGSAFGTATYGATRADVCSSIAGAANCPGVGWNASLNSALLGNGQHILEITMSTAAGHRASVNTVFTVANPATGPGHIGIDNPSSSSNPFQGTVLFSGWALNDNAAVSSVTVSIDGVPYGTASTTSRPDICVTYPGRAGCPNVGWTFGLDTTRLPDGQHTLGITENNANGTFYTVSSAFTIGNYTTSNPLIINIDAPTNAFPIYGSLTISGWATVPNAQIASIKIALDGVPLGNAIYGTPRTDVCLVTTSPSCPNVGWYFTGFDTQTVPNGTHFLDITATTVLGQTSTVSSQITIAN
jgi:uncharacterized protein (TIGR03437 family)